MIYEWFGNWNSYFHLVWPRGWWNEIRDEQSPSVQESKHRQGLSYGEAKVPDGPHLPGGVHLSSLQSPGSTNLTWLIGLIFCKTLSPYYPKIVNFVHDFMHLNLTAKKFFNAEAQRSQRFL